MIYLAAPYSDTNPAVRERRYEAACLATATLLRHGHVVYSPIVHGHPLVRYGLPIDWSYWERTDREFLAHCDEVFVLTLEGWEQSVGVNTEICVAIALGKPVRYLDPVTLSVHPRGIHHD